MAVVVRNRWTHVYKFSSDFCRRKLRISRRRETNTANQFFPFILQHSKVYESFIRIRYK